MRSGEPARRAWVSVTPSLQPLAFEAVPHAQRMHHEVEACRVARSCGWFCRFSPLMRAAYYGAADVVDELLEKGANPHLLDRGHG